MTNKMFQKLGAWDDGMLAVKPITARVPVHVLARLMTICELFPNKTRSEIIIELLKGGLEKFEESLPPIYYTEEDNYEGELIKIPRGPKFDYQQGSNNNNAKLEAEMNKKSSGPLFSEIG